MNGNDFVDLLQTQLKSKNDNKLSQRLGVQPPNINYWRQQKTVTKGVLRNVLQKYANAAVKASIDPIAEFRMLDPFHGHYLDTLTKRIGSKHIIERLKKAKGIYLFCDSSGKIVYCGRTTKSYLLTEMKQAYDLPRPQYVRKFTNAQNVFRNVKLKIRNTAFYFSAYEVDDVLIARLEAFVTRIVPNDLINRRTERFT